MIQKSTSFCVFDLLKGAALVLILGFHSSSPFAPAQDDCGECPNPLVEMKNLDREGIEKLGDLYKKLASEYYGWQEGEESLLDVLTRGFNFLQFKKQNPCAEMSYVVERPSGEGLTVGARRGAAKYSVESTLRMTAAQPGDTARAIRVIYDEKGNTVSEKEDLVPKLGTVQVHHRLVCLKNNDTYDTGDYSLDWLADPPPNEGYFRPEGSDGIIVGLFSTGSIAGLPVEFRRGDVGRTIRNKETPASFMLDVDNTLYPPYYQLKIRDIRNLFGEALPNKISVAIRPKHGEIIGGKKVNGWSVFSTQGAAINEPFLYRVPECSKTNKELIEIAAYCDWHAGEPTVGQPRASQQFFIPVCFDLSLSITNTEHTTFQRELSTTITDVNYAFLTKKTEFSETKEEYSAFVVFGKKPKHIEFISRDRLLYVYEAASWHSGTYQFHLHSEQDDLDEMDAPLKGIEHSHSTFHKWGKVVRLEPLSTELHFIYDKQKDEIVSVEEIPAFDVHQSFEQTRVYDYENTFPPAPRSEHKVETASEEEVRGHIGETIPPDTFSGDRKTVLVGYGRKEERKPPTNEGMGPVSDIVSSSNVQTIRWELRRR